jgi:hypothetical protein
MSWTSVSNGILTLGGARFDLAFLIGALIVLVFALGSLWAYRSSAKERRVMEETPTSKARDVARLAPGTLVEVKGTLRCPQLVTAEFSKEPCVYFKAEIHETEVYYETDSSGKRERKTRTNTVYSNCKFAPCTVEDASGSVALSLDGASVEGNVVVDRPEGVGTGLAAGILDLAVGINHRDRNLKEMALPADIPIYVLGEVQADGSIGKHAKGSHNRIFVVSKKSEEERAAALQSDANFWLITAGVIAAVAAGLVAWGWWKAAG